MKLTDLFKNLLNWEVSEHLADPLNNVYQSLGDAGAVIGSLLAGGGANLGNIAASAGMGTSDILRGTGAGIYDALVGAGDSIGRVGSGFLNGVTNAGSQIRAAAQHMSDTFRNADSSDYVYDPYRYSYRTYNPYSNSNSNSSGSLSSGTNTDNATAYTSPYNKRKQYGNYY